PLSPLITPTRENTAAAPAMPAPVFWKTAGKKEKKRKTPSVTKKSLQFLTPCVSIPPHTVAQRERKNGFFLV
ncbi:MAG: hypothetical protein Q4F52_10140, partial [Bacteroidaceae bacterium]|nr:hypothetical protein [Bacteroidaceae bacterium]